MFSTVKLHNEWTVIAHPCFQEQFNALTAEVDKVKANHPDDYQSKACTKLLAIVLKVIEQGITVNPGGNEYRQGKTMGSAYRHWRRAKFAAGRYRLFFRYSEDQKLIVLAWMNDESTLRTYGAKSDAYSVFGRMLDAGIPPDDWEELVKATMESMQPGRALRVIGGKHKW